MPQIKDYTKRGLQQSGIVIIRYYSNYLQDWLVVFHLLEKGLVQSSFGENIELIIVVLYTMMLNMN